jgi:dephospho-CoA kinase
MIAIVPYREGWADEFVRWRKRIGECLGPRALRIDHVGSTSVPGLAAKDVIDIQVTVSNLAHADPLAAAGSVRNRSWKITVHRA